jgi:hypothetical protein
LAAAAASALDAYPYRLIALVTAEVGMRAAHPADPCLGFHEPSLRQSWGHFCPSPHGHSTLVL